MKHSNKKSGLYEFLSRTGVLANGSDEAIDFLKKQYWNTVRKEWKQKRRQECKSYTVFFTTNELNILTKVIKQTPGGITKYIKQATLSHATGKANIDKHCIGRIRKALAIHYSTVQELMEEETIVPTVGEKLLKQVAETENILFEQV
jgi:transcriptional regulator NrdR family protein